LSGGLRRILISAVCTALAVLGLIYGGRYALSRMDFFTLERVRVEGLKHLSRTDILELLPVHPGENLFRIDLEEVRRLVEAHPWVASAQVSRDLPRTLVIRVREEDPVAITVRGKKLYFLNVKGEAFAEAPQKALFEYPVVSAEAPGILRREADFLRLLAWVRDRDIYLPCYESISQVYLGKDRIVLYTKEGLRVRFRPEPLAELKADYRRLDRILTYLYDNRLYRRAALIRLDYPEGTALLAWREEGNS